MSKKNPQPADSTPVTAADLAWATKLLKGYLADNAPAGPEQPAPAPFQPSKKGLDVLRWLQAAGYQIEKSKLYEDIKAGYLKTDKHGIFTVRLVKAYAKRLPKAATGKTEAEGKLDLGQQKQKEEVEKLQLHNKRERFNFDVERGRYLPREDLDRELAARMVVLDTGLERLIREQAAQLIHIAGGDQKNAEHVIDLLTTEKDALLNSYATTKTFHVLILPETEKQDVPL